MGGIRLFNGFGRNLNPLFDLASDQGIDQGLIVFLLAEGVRGIARPF